MGQLKINIDNDLLMKFKKIVLAKRGKLDISIEGAEAIRLYIEKYKHILSDNTNVKDPLEEIIGSVKSKQRRNALEDLKQLEAEEL
ncbi:MAG: hypothetical protein ACP6IS_09905 [Candidatus Asgardarchaeia archaeon]